MIYYDFFKDSAEINKKDKRQNHRYSNKTTVQNRLGDYLTDFEKLGR
jgi:hypothetical protein